MHDSFENKVAVLLLTYRKPDFLKEILGVISEYMPKKLYISSDNYKSIKDYFDVKRVRRLIKKTSLPFETEYLFHKKHLALNEVFQATIDHVFAQEEYLIILEDDVVPSLAFFEFCEKMLIKYKNSPEIGCINGCNLNVISKKDTSFLSGISFPYWGWATWKSKWTLYRADNFYWNNYREEILNQISDQHIDFFTTCFDSYSQNFNVWDIQWNLSLLANQQKTILPCENLTMNKGFSLKATTTKYKSISFGNLTMSSHLKTDFSTVEDNKSLLLQYEKRVIQLVTEMNDNNNHRKNENLVKP